MAGGPSTVPLAAAVSEVGGLGFLATGYRTADAVTEDLAALKIATTRPFGLNVFVPSAAPADPEAVQAYAERLTAAGLPAGEARFDDDAFDEKIALLARARPAVVSFAFGLPPAAAVAELQEAGVAVWVTVTTPAEAAAAAQAGADALVAQGAEAGGHRGGFDGGEPGDLGLLAFLQLCETAAEGVPLVATGGIMTGRAVAAVLAAGAAASVVLVRRPPAGAVLVTAGLCTAGAAAIHFAVTQEHVDEWWGYGVFFFLSGWLQLLWAAVAVRVSSRALLAVGLAGNALVAAIWVASRTTGLPFGPEAGEAEALSWADTIASSFEAVAALCCLALLVRPVAVLRLRVPPTLVAGATAALTTLALLTAVGGHSH